MLRRFPSSRKASSQTLCSRLPSSAYRRCLPTSAAAQLLTRTQPPEDLRFSFSLTNHNSPIASHHLQLRPFLGSQSSVRGRSRLMLNLLGDFPDGRPHQSENQVSQG